MENYGNRLLENRIQNASFENTFRQEYGTPEYPSDSEKGISSSMQDGCEKAYDQETAVEDLIYRFNPTDKTVQNMDEEGKELPETSYSFRIFV